MKLYEINEQLENLLEIGFDEDCIDPETGEVLEEKVNEKIEALNLAREDKLENVGLYIKCILADIDAIKNEEKALAARRGVKENKVKSLKEFLTYALAGEKFETAKIKLSFRKSEAVEITDQAALPDTYIKTVTTSSPDKTAIKDALKAGATVPGAVLKENQNLQVK